MEKITNDNSLIRKVQMINSKIDHCLGYFETCYLGLMEWPRMQQRYKNCGENP
jgi:hypothetical protein